MTTEIAKTNSSAIQGTNDFQIPAGYICTFDISTIAGKMKLASTLNGAVSMKDKVGDALLVTDVVTTQGARARTGEVCTNTYLICEDGTAYFTQSDGIARSVKVLVALFTDQNTHEFINPVSLGVAFQIKEQELANGNTLKSVIPVELPQS